MQSLFRSPRQVVDPFVAGEDSPFMHPAWFCLAPAVVVTILNAFFIDFSPLAEMPVEQGDDPALGDLLYWLQLVNIRVFTQFLPLLVATLLVPMLALGTLIFLRDELDGFYHGLVLFAYGAGAVCTGLLLLLPVWWFSPLPIYETSMYSVLPAALISFIYLMILRRYLQPDSIMSWIRMISAYASGYIFYSLIAGFLAGLLGFFAFWIAEVMAAMQAT
ncbi:MAG: hypothetical protein ACNA78_03375 [Balneolaceae bacterium]